MSRDSHTHTHTHYLKGGFLHEVLVSVKVLWVQNIVNPYNKTSSTKNNITIPNTANSKSGKFKV